MYPRKTTTPIIALALSSAVACSGAARAAELGFYMVGAYGQTSRSGVERSSFDEVANLIYGSRGFIPTISTSTLGDDTDSGFMISGGYRLLPYLAVEGSYLDLGEIGYRNESTMIFDEQSATWGQRLESSASGMALSALGIWPLSYRWEVYGRGGVLFATNTLDIYLTDFRDALTGDVSDSSTELFAGVGGTFSFAEVYGVRLEYQRVFGLSGSNGAGEGDVDFISLGVMVSF